MFRDLAFVLVTTEISVGDHAVGRLLLKDRKDKFHAVIAEYFALTEVFAGLYSGGVIGPMVTGFASSFHSN